MKLVDANVLLYAVNRDAGHHEASRRWLEVVLSGDETVGLAWVALLAFVRLSTKLGLFPRPLSVEEAWDRVDGWLAAAPAVELHPHAGHARRIRDLLAPLGTGGNLVNDAHLAALAIEHRATLVSWDHDFGRFTGLRWRTPAADS